MTIILVDHQQYESGKATSGEVGNGTDDDYHYYNEMRVSLPSRRPEVTLCG